MIDPNYADGWYNKGLTLDSLKKYEEAIKYYTKAIECYDKAIKLDPTDANAWFYRGSCKVKTGNIENGLIDLEKAIEIGKQEVIEMAQKDNDFESIRNDERFKAILDRHGTYG